MDKTFIDLGFLLLVEVPSKGEIKIPPINEDNVSYCFLLVEDALTIDQVKRKSTK